MEAYYLINSKRRNVPYTWLFISKQVLTIALILLSVIEIILVVQASEDYSVEYYTPFIKIVTFVSTITYFILIIYSRYIYIF